MTIVIDPKDTGQPTIDRPPIGVVGPYHLLERIGAGGLGEVFRARDTVHGRTVALKRVPSAVTADRPRAASLRETAEKLSHISHPGVAMLYECGEEIGELYLVQEFVPGQRLTDLLGGRPLNPRRAVEIGIEIADALAAIHAAGQLHGDLRPDNVVITPKGHAKLLDAGLSAFTAGGAVRASAGAKITAAPGTATLGVVRYISPEQAVGERLDARSDVFALGAVLYEMLTGRPAFDGNDTSAVVLNVLCATPPAPRSHVATVPAELDLVTARALAKSLDRRYATARDVADDLRTVQRVFEPEVEPAALIVESEARRSWLPLVLVGTLALLLLAGWLYRAELAALF
jgi:serine/threonine protein kinase